MACNNSQESTKPKRLRAAGIEGRNNEDILWLDDAQGALIQKLEVHNIPDNTIKPLNSGRL